MDSKCRPNDSQVSSAWHPDVHPDVCFFAKIPVCLSAVTAFRKQQTPVAILAEACLSAGAHTGCNSRLHPSHPQLDRNADSVWWRCEGERKIGLPVEAAEIRQ